MPKSLSRFQRATGVARFVTRFYRLTFVIELLTLTKSDNELDEATLGEEHERDDGHALFFLSGKCVNFFTFSEQSAWAEID